MTTMNPTAPFSHRPRGRRHPVTRAGRFVGAAILLAVAAAAVANSAVYRAFEAWGAAIALRPFVSEHTGSGGDVFWVADDSSVTGFRVTIECTGIILLVPLLALSAVLLLATRAPAWRVFAGAASMYLIITVINEARLALIGYSTTTWGIDQGYTISHTFVGSAIGILGFAAGLAALLLVSLRKPRERR